MDEMTNKVVEVVVEKALEKSVELVVERLRALLPTEGTKRLYRKLAEDAAFEASGYFRLLVERLGKDPEVVAAHIAATVTDEQAAALFGKLFPEAVYAATTDRRRLIAAALAGTFDPNYDVEMKSRLARAITMLEPSDVLVLRRMAEQHDPLLASTSGPHQVSLPALQAAQCTTAAGHFIGQIQGVAVTEFGRTLLRWIADWQPSTPTP
ncbi:MAG: hypothetical protein ACYC8T_34710 [Myxococcaceae bacterium]